MEVKPGRLPVGITTAMEGLLQHPSLGGGSGASVCSYLLFAFNWVENNVMCFKKKKNTPLVI